MNAALVLVVAMAVPTGPPDRISTVQAKQAIMVPGCYVTLISDEDIEVPAQESGLLVAMDVRQGELVKTSEVLARIDDRRSQMKRTAALIELKAARQEADNDIEVKYSEAAYKVAEANYLQSVEANRNMKGTTSAAEIRRLDLTRKRAYLQIERSKNALEIARMKAEVNQEAVASAEEDIRRRKILSPLDGIVLSVFRNKGEWVDPGDPVMQVARINRLNVEGIIDCSKYSPSEIFGRPVTVSVSLKQGRTEQFTGRIVYISPNVQSGNRCRIRAEVENRTEFGHWMMQPGMTANMVIQPRGAKTPALARPAAGGGYSR